MPSRKNYNADEMPGLPPRPVSLLHLSPDPEPQRGENKETVSPQSIRTISLCGDDGTSTVNGVIDITTKWEVIGDPRAG